MWHACIWHGCWHLLYLYYILSYVPLVPPCLSLFLCACLATFWLLGLAFGTGKTWHLVGVVSSSLIPLWTVPLTAKHLLPSNIYIALSLTTYSLLSPPPTRLPLLLLYLRLAWLSCISSVSVFILCLGLWCHACLIC